MKALLITLIFFSFSTFANQAPTPKSKIQNKVIDIEGSVYQQELTPAQKQKKIRKQLEKKTEQLVKKQIQMLRLQREMLLQKRLKAIFDQQMKALEQIQQ